MKWFKSKAEQPEEKPGFVRVFDLQTKTITQMPARELASCMVEVRMQGVDGEVWVDARELKQGEHKHPPFSEEARDYLRQIKASIDEFYNLSLDEWEDGFRRDATPEREIALWLHLAKVYKRLTATCDLSFEQRRDYFRVLVTCMNSPRENVFNVYSPEAISREEAQNVVAEFYGADA